MIRDLLPCLIIHLAQRLHELAVWMGASCTPEPDL